MSKILVNYDKPYKNYEQNRGSAVNHSKREVASRDAGDWDAWENPCQ